MRVPPALFTDLSTYEEELLKRPSCACFLSVDAGLPTGVARLHLDYRQNLGTLSRFELQRFCRNRERWFRNVLPSHHDRQRFLSMPCELPVFITARAPAQESLEEQLGPIVRELSFMFSIYDRAVFGDHRRLAWLFRAALEALHDAGRNDPELDPVGWKLLHQAGVGSGTREYLMRLRGAVGGGPGFAGYEVALTTQLRILHHLALAKTGCSRAALNEKGDEERRHIVDDLARALCMGLELDPNERPEDLRAWFGREVYSSSVVEPAARYDGLEDWLHWASRREEPLAREFLCDQLSNLPKRYDECVMVLVDALRLDTSEIDRIQRRRTAAPERMLSATFNL